MVVVVIGVVIVVVVHVVVVVIPAVDTRNIPFGWNQVINRWDGVDVVVVSVFVGFVVVAVVIVFIVVVVVDPKNLPSKLC